MKTGTWTTRGALLAAALLAATPALASCSQDTKGETKTADDADVTAVYNLFTSARDDGTISGLAQNQLDYPCRLDPTTGAEYDDAFKKDAGYVIRSWMAVVTFLIADYRFLYD